MGKDRKFSFGYGTNSSIYERGEHIAVKLKLLVFWLVYIYSPLHSVSLQAVYLAVSILGGQ